MTFLRQFFGGNLTEGAEIPAGELKNACDVIITMRETSFLHLLLSPITNMSSHHRWILYIYIIDVPSNNYYHVWRILLQIS